MRAIQLEEPRLGLRANIGQFSLLVVVNAFVGSMVGLERSILPTIADQEFHLAARSAILSFIVVFGIAKAVTNYAAGRLSDSIGRKKVLVAGWIVAVPVASVTPVKLLPALGPFTTFNATATLASGWLPASVTWTSVVSWVPTAWGAPSVRSWIVPPGTSMPVVPMGRQSSD